MSDLTGLIAICFLGATGFFLSFFVAKLVNDLGIQIATGVVNGTPISTGVRHAMLFQMWLPYQMGQVAALVFFAIAFLEMADQVAGAGVKLVAYLLAFIAGVSCLMGLMTTTFGLFQYRARLLRAATK